MKRMVPAFLAISLLGFTLVGCERDVAWNQRTVLHFVTPHGPMQASSVIKVKFGHPTAFSRNFLIGGGGVRSQLKGEAIIADFGNGKVLIALLKRMEFVLRDAVYNKQEENAEHRSFIKDGGIGISRAAAQFYNPIEVQPDSWPLMVTFGEIANPTSVQLVDPENISDFLGEGYKLTHITVQATRDPVTEGNIAKFLPCINSGKNCIPINESLDFGDPLRFMPNSVFLRDY